MDKTDARRLIEEQLLPFREMPYPDLAQLIGQEPTTGEITAETGKTYQYEIQVFWDDKPDGEIRVIGNIDDGGWRAFFPLGADLLIAPPESGSE